VVEFLMNWQRALRRVISIFTQPQLKTDGFCLGYPEYHSGWKSDQVIIDSMLRQWMNNQLSIIVTVFPISWNSLVGWDHMNMKDTENIDSPTFNSQCRRKVKLSNCQRNSDSRFLIS
jgi:hypothetical protein